VQGVLGMQVKVLGFKLCEETEARTRDGQLLSVAHDGLSLKATGCNSPGLYKLHKQLLLGTLMELQSAF
jgi:hypothetical protein